MPGSTTTRGQHASCDIDARRVAFCGTENIGTPNLSYAAQYIACALPCERFTSALASGRASLGAGVARYAFTATDFHRLPSAGLPAHPSHGIRSGLVHRSGRGIIQARAPPRRKILQMSHSELAILLATREDVPGILDLQERNLSEHGGKLSVRWSAEWFEHAIAEMPIVVARSGGRVVGYLVSTSQSAQAHNPIVQAMLATCRPPVDAYVYGPICVEEEQRKRGVAALMFRCMRTQLPCREAFTFIRGDNLASRAVATKLGMREIAMFEHRGVEYIVAAYIV
jgi:hypothetical protein